MKITRREKILMIAVASVIAVVLYGWLVFLPESHTISSLDAEYNTYVVDKVRVKNSSAYLKNMNLKLEEIQKQLIAKSKAISQPIRVPDILSDFYSTASEEKLEIGAIELSDNAAVKGDGIIIQNDNTEKGQSAADQEKKQQNTDKLKVLTAKLNLKGSYNGIMNFIRHYELNSRLFIVESIKISGNKGGCTSEVTFKTYSIVTDSGSFLYSTGSTGIPKDPFTGIPEPEKKVQDSTTLPGILLPGTKLPDGTTIPGMLYPYYPGMNLPGTIIPGTTVPNQNNDGNNTNQNTTVQGATTGDSEINQNSPKN